MAPSIEVCVDSVAGARAAEAAGADRIELCAGLVEGGTTPSAGLIAAVRAAVALRITVLVRPRAGDFLYTDAERGVVRRDLHVAADCGAHGVALGALRADASIDLELVGDWIGHARPLEVTFHRAFDFVLDAEAGLEQLIRLGADRLLTAGQATSVETGADCLARLVAEAGERIVIVAGGGVRPHNVRALVERTGVRAVHLSASGFVESAMRERRADVRMGSEQVPGEYVRRVTDADQVRAVVAALR